MLKQFVSFKQAGILFSLLAMMVTGCDSSQEFEELQQKADASKTASREQEGARASSFDYNLALYWGPVHFQDTDVTGTYSLSGKSDYITSVNFDGDWVATNNWNNAGNYSLPAHAYFSVVETSTHWYIVYMFFHPRDWTDNPFLYTLDQHENDSEGLLAIVKRDGTTYGSLQGVVTVAHSDFYSFVPSGSPLQANAETIDGTLSYESFNGNNHPMTAQEAKGHGLKAYPYFNINGDGIKYYPSLTTAEVPSSADDRSVSYRLIDIFENGGLWGQRTNTSLFSSAAGGFLSSYGSGGANAPWAWDDGNDLPGVGELATDPARVANNYFKNFGSIDLNYTRNTYRGIN